MSALCAAAGVSRSAYYACCRSTPSQRTLANERLLAEIRSIHVENESRYGSPRICDELKDRGHSVGKHRVAHLMQEYDESPSDLLGPADPPDGTSSTYTMYPNPTPGSN